MSESWRGIGLGESKQSWRAIFQDRVFVSVALCCVAGSDVKSAPSGSRRDRGLLVRIRCEGGVGAQRAEEIEVGGGAEGELAEGFAVDGDYVGEPEG